MANWDYRSSYFNSSWVVSSDSGRKVTASLSLRTTIDQPKQSTTNWKARFAHFSTYTRLNPDQIRVLHLNPGSKGTPLSGDFSIITYNPSIPDHERPQYESLSWVWGDGRGDKEPFLLGEETIYIYKSLSEALNAIRSDNSVRTLWVDALCINQNHIEEKSHQVSQMDMTYRRAARVLAWLGRGNEQSAIGMQALSHMSTGYIEGRNFWYAQPPEILVPAIEDIMSRPYWQRIWVVQESALAKKTVLICGEDSFEWTNNLGAVLAFLRSVKLAAISPGWPPGLSIHPMTELLDRQLENGPDAALWARRRPGVDVLSVAYELRNRQAVDARDKMYAILGLLDDETAGKLAPSYTIPIEEAFDKFVRLVESHSASYFAQLMQPLENLPALDTNPKGASHDSKESKVQPRNERTLASGRFQGGAESLCLEAVRLMGAGQLAEASRILGRAQIILNSDLQAQHGKNNTLPRVEATESIASEAVTIQKTGTW